MEGVYVITGGTRGIGAATARLLARPGTALVLGFHADQAAADDLVEELNTGDHPVEVVRCEVADPAQIGDLFAKADALGPLRGLVNSAGTTETQSRFVDIDADRWTRILATNVVGTAMCCREAARRMLDASAGRRGAIVNVSSRAAALGSPGEYVDYAASKAAIETLTRGLALELAPEGIRVNAVSPGIIDTHFHARGGDPDRAARLAWDQPLRRCGTPEEVAEAIVWLLSEKASFTTGAVLDVSGGR
ncbi:SDR family oxidoreductase [Mobilicoccus sp.]|uniref:SDR family oxidoreductase n=1 Tax=Mobilicoccus sp. TaxID=2034349 RepID=UPI0028A58DA5|nr:SDR family oxidoreductase [Mobilicoccus sp.]